MDFEYSIYNFAMHNSIQDDLDAINSQANASAKIVPSLQKAIQKSDGKNGIKTKRLRVEEVIRNINDEKIAKLENDLEVLRNENKNLRAQLQEKTAEIVNLLTSIDVSIKKPRVYEKRIVRSLSLLKRSTQDLANAVKQLHDCSSTLHHISKSHTLNSSPVSDQLNDSFVKLNTIPQSRDTQTPTSLSIPKWKRPTYPDGSSRKQLVPGHNIYIDHVKFSACNKKHGINRYVSDLLISLVGDSSYLSSVSLSGKQSNAHSDKQAKPKICEDLVDAVIACASQIMDVSSKEVRTAIMSKLNIASKIEKMKKIKKQL